jgi:hypothetical protein
MYNDHMSTNGRSNAPQAHITTSDEKRRERWLYLFGRDTLPVLAAEPRWEEQGGAFPVLVYDLALSQLTDAQIARFAGYLSRKYRTDYAHKLAELNGRVSYPIKASIDIQVLEPAEQTPSLASLFGDVAGRLLRRHAPLWRRLARV